MKSRPLVNIIIINWNSVKDTVSCLENVFSMEYPNFQVIVVDNGSIDNSVSVLQDFNNDIQLIKNGKNLGTSGGHNAGITRALQQSADYVWLLNNDTKVCVDSLSKLVDAMDRDPRLGLVSPVIYDLTAEARLQFSGALIDRRNRETSTLVVMSRTSWKRRKGQHRMTHGLILTLPNWRRCSLLL